MSETAEVYRGACLCGAVRYEFSGTFERFFLCHCSRCRKATGSAHAANMFFSDANLTWLSGAELVKSFTVEGARHTRTFCATCGSALPEQQSGGRLKLPAGSLESPTDKRPLAHIWTSARADWDDHLEDVPAFETRPS